MPPYQIIGRVKFFWHDRWLERDVNVRVDAPSEPAAVSQAFAVWQEKVRRGNRSDQPDLHRISATAAVDLAALPIQVGDRVTRKADCTNVTPIHGTVERILILGAQPKHWKAAVRWHGNVRYLSGRTDQKSTLQVSSLVKVASA
jgi:hypothetical protein